MRGALREDVRRVYSAETLPAYFALWPPAQHAEAMVRIRLVHAQLWGYFVRRQMGVDPDRDLLLDTLVDVWTSTLYPKPT